MRTEAFPTTKDQVVTWVRKIRKSNDEVLVSNFCYNCLFTKEPKTKTLIVLPEDLPERGVASINKPLEQVDLMDIIQLYNKIKKHDNE